MNMKKWLAILLAVQLVCLMFTGIASAEFGYSSVSKVPMAVDFTFSAEIDEFGYPHIKTNYPFTETGAMDMVLTYEKKGHPRAVELHYDPKTGTTRFGRLDEELFSKQDMTQEASQRILDGELTQGSIFIGTLHGGENTDWWLEYSVPLQQYVKYEERTFSIAYNALYTNATVTEIHYADGVLTDSFIRIPSDGAVFHSVFDAYGKRTRSTFVWQYDPDWNYYYYDPETDLFDGKKIDELGLGFEEADLEITAPAALDPLE